MALQAMNAARPRVVLLVTSIALLLMPTLVVADRDMSLYDVRDVSEYIEGEDLAIYISVSSWLPFGPNPSSIPEDPFSWPLSLQASDLRTASRPSPSNSQCYPIRSRRR
jgi:hypothetical protein